MSYDGGFAVRPATNADLVLGVRVVTFSFLCPLLEKYGTFIARCNALIEKVSSFRVERGAHSAPTDGRRRCCPE
eukprot:SAG31_NODE_168_length_21484_cov_21.524994_5_plen_74_part_00